MTSRVTTTMTRRTHGVGIGPEAVAGQWCPDGDEARHGVDLEVVVAQGVGGLQRVSHRVERRLETHSTRALAVLDSIECRTVLNGA